MSNRKAKAAPVVDDYETQADRELDEELDETLSIGDDDDDEELDDAGDPIGMTKCLYCGCTEERACSTPDGPCSWIPGDEPVCTNPKCLRRHRAAGGVLPDEVLPQDDSEAAGVAVAVQFLSAFTIATLPTKMKLKPLAAQSNEWLLATIGRVVDEIGSAEFTKTPGGIADLERDLAELFAAADVRGIVDQLSLAQRDVFEQIIERDLGGDDEAAPPASSATNLQVTYIPRQAIHPDPAQPRAHADDELKESIRASGILQPITVRPLVDTRGEYIIVDGERRWQGAEDVLEVIPCIVRDDQEDEYTRLKTQLVANTGKALSPIEEARAFARMLEANNVGVAALARDIGRPPSSVNDRLKLLELGPWLEWIDNGSVSLSMAVEHLVPLRGIADEYHAEAIAKLTDGLTPGEQISENVEDFGHAVGREYDRYMYPLSKTKNSYEKQPLFNTKAHDAECSCGGISWGGSWQGVEAKGRKFCGNPDWWKPLHAAAKKEERAAAKESGESAPAKKGQMRIELPAGAKTVNVGYGQPPKDVISLTDSEGRWSVTHWLGGDLEDAFDPADLAIEETKLVRLKQSYGMDRVGTKDLAAVKKAREAFAARFAPARERHGKKVVADFEKLVKIYGVAGAGVHQLLGTIDIGDREFAEAADLLSIEVPTAVRKTERDHKTSASLDWFAKSLKRADAEKLLSFCNYLLASEKYQLPSAVVLKDVRETVGEIQKKRAPWATSKAAKPAAAK